MSSSSASNPHDLPAPLGGNRESPTWLPMIVGGLFATLAISGSALINAWHRRRRRRRADARARDHETVQQIDPSEDQRTAGRGRPGRHRERERRSLTKLRAAIVGNDKDAIVKVLGPPPTTG